jgi:hypothetical protein
MTTPHGFHGECAVRDIFGRCDEQVRQRRAAHGSAEPFIANQTWEKWMKLVKISAIAFAVSAVLAGPVLAQGASSDTQIRGGAQGRTNMQGGASGAGEEDLNAQQTAPGEKAGVNAKSRGTVGAATGGAPKATGGAMSDPPAAPGKRY